jgi:uncharacterized membrane protein
MAVERLIARVLLWGGVVAVALMCVGLIGYAARAGTGADALNTARVMDNREGGRAAHMFTSPSQIVRGLRQRPIDLLAVTMLGVLTMLATPLVAVAGAIPAFLAAGDTQYATIATLLTAALIASLWFGGG